jgi:AraC-like DNA-binding protein
MKMRKFIFIKSEKGFSSKKITAALIPFVLIAITFLVLDITEIGLHKNMWPFYIYSVGLLMFYFTEIPLSSFPWKRRKKLKVNFNNNRSILKNTFEEEEEMVFKYLNSNYYKHDLTVIQLQEATNIHERKVSKIIKDKTNMSFKQFLNKLRLTEAKKMLTDSDMQISEIGYKVGYGNISHFNRIFKATENCTPNEYRRVLQTT